MEKGRHDVPTTPGFYEGTWMDPTMGRNPSPLAYKRRPRSYKKALLVRRTFSRTRALSRPEEQLLLTNTP
jgi:hypothetical protein